MAENLVSARRALRWLQIIHLAKMADVAWTTTSNKWRFVEHWPLSTSIQQQPQQRQTAEF
jgi:hypothetical protein